MIIGYAYVVGDILHRGHILHLKNCKALCDRLIVGVLSDEAVMEKKPKPVLSLEERMLLVESLKFVDCVVMQDEYSPTANCRLMHPDILFESDSHDEWGNNYDRKIIAMPYYKKQSSTKIKKEIKSGNSN